MPSCTSPRRAMSTARSTVRPRSFETNVVGTFSLAQRGADLLARAAMPRRGRPSASTTSRPTRCSATFRSTTAIFTEETPYAPSSPYSASKAASDHFVRAWHETYGLPVVLSNCSNNYGPYHFPEKLIPLVILNALEEQAAAGLRAGRQRPRLALSSRTMPARSSWCLTRGTVGESYNIGGRAERTNLQVVEAICDMLDRKRPRPDGAPHRELISL